MATGTDTEAKDPTQTDKTQPASMKENLWRIVITVLVTGDFAVTLFQDWIKAELPKMIEFVGTNIFVMVVILSTIVAGGLYLISALIRGGVKKPFPKWVAILWGGVIAGFEILLAYFIVTRCMPEPGKSGWYWVGFVAMVAALVLILIATALAGGRKLTLPDNKGFRELLQDLRTEFAKGILALEICGVVAGIGLVCAYAMTLTQTLP